MTAMKNGERRMPAGSCGRLAVTKSSKQNNNNHLKDVRLLLRMKELELSSSGEKVPE